MLTEGADDTTVSLEDHMLPLYWALKENKKQKVKFIIYQAGHSYKNVQEKLIKDVADWIKNK